MFRLYFSIMSFYGLVANCSMGSHAVVTWFIVDKVYALRKIRWIFLTICRAQILSRRFCIVSWESESKQSRVCFRRNYLRCRALFFRLPQKKQISFSFEALVYGRFHPTMADFINLKFKTLFNSIGNYFWHFLETIKPIIIRIFEIFLFNSNLEEFYFFEIQHGLKSNMIYQ